MDLIYLLDKICCVLDCVHAAVNCNFVFGHSYLFVYPLGNCVRRPGSTVPFPIKNAVLPNVCWGHWTSKEPVNSLPCFSVWIRYPIWIYRLLYRPIYRPISFYEKFWNHNFLVFLSIFSIWEQICVCLCLYMLGIKITLL